MKISKIWVERDMLGQTQVIDKEAPNKSIGEYPDNHGCIKGDTSAVYVRASLPDVIHRNKSIFAASRNKIGIV